MPAEPVPDSRPTPAAPPALTLPKGGGAIRGIGEKFAANPVTGTGAVSIPLPLSPARSSFEPSLTLSYDSGAGNGVFGMGWALSAPSITRKTDKGLPQYRDAEESDVFLISGAEDLVPVLDENGRRFVDTAPGFTIHRYRPRVETAYARIERWTSTSGEMHWRSYSPDNLLTVFGATGASRVADPADQKRVFQWLVCEVRDDKGNGVLYDYVAENGSGIDSARPQERNRGGPADPRRAVHRYLKRIRYGNRQSLLSADGTRPATVPPAVLDTAGWMFEVVLDYDEGHLTSASPDDEGRQFVTAGIDPAVPWALRPDPFSTHRAGFEIRLTRRCRRVLLFHHFPDDLAVGDACLTRSVEFEYAATSDVSSYSFLDSVTECGYVRSGDEYLRRSRPAREFTYSQPVLGAVVEDAAGLAVPPGAGHQWVDLHGEGLPGFLTEQAGAWFYARNRTPLDDAVVRFTPTETVASRPAHDLASAQLMDLDGDGRADLVVLDDHLPGRYPHDEQEGWLGFRPFASRPVRALHDPRIRWTDLDGDGLADILVTDEGFSWYPSLAADGFGPSRHVATPYDEEAGPPSDLAAEGIQLADLSGDGLSDLVRIRNGEVCYWPNLGYGRFGPKVTMDGSPLFDTGDQFDPRRLRLADIDGTGTTDLIYLHRTGVRLYFNQCGNGWSPARVLPVFPAVDDLATISVADLLGNGTACLLWSSPLAAEAGRPLRYVRLMGDQKPHLLVASTDNLGARTRVEYASSTRFYLQDQQDGRPWLTRLAFPVHVVARVETDDQVTGSRFVSRYAYHHGYYDGPEREFRGFAMVEQWDSGDYAGGGDDVVPVPPVLTRTWFHTGWFLGGDRISTGLAHEYYWAPGQSDALLPDTVLPVGLPPDEQAEACRALKGSMLRQETYGLDGTAAAEHPYLVVENDFTIRPLQPRAGNRHGVFSVHPRESISYHFERDPADPRIGHECTLQTDDYGNVLKSATIGYGRSPDRILLTGDDRTPQAQLLITYTEHDVTQADTTEPDRWTGNYRTPRPAETRVYQITGLAPDDEPLFRFERLAGLLPGLPEIPYEQTPDPGTPSRRAIERIRTRYRRDDLTDLLALGTHQPLGLPGESYRLAFTPGLLDALTTGRLDDPAGTMTGDGGYVQVDGLWWIPTGQVRFSPSSDAAAELADARTGFFRARRYLDAFGRTTLVDYDPDRLLPVRVEDPVGNIITADYDHRVLQPRSVTDPNGNRSLAAFDALGLVTGTAVTGKAGEGDSLAGFVADLSPRAVTDYFAAVDPSPAALAHLGPASTRFLYDLDQIPHCSATIARTEHQRDVVQLAFGYLDGLGRELQRKIQAEPGPGGPRWVGSGWTIYDAKGRPIRQFEPFFSDTPALDTDVRVGVSPWLIYDPPGRVVAVVHPDHTYEKVVFGPWEQTTFDGNDTVVTADGSADPTADPDVGSILALLPVTADWYARRMALAPDDPDRLAAQATYVHRQTPSVAHLDVLGRPFLTVAHNRSLRDGAEVEEFYPTRLELDIEGNRRSVRDALARLVMRYDYDLAGRATHQASMEAGERWTLGDATGKPIRVWDSRGFTRRLVYDDLRRPTDLWVTENAAERLAERTVYGESQGDADNHRGRVYQSLDAAGLVTIEAYDFKGNVLANRRELLADVHGAVGGPLSGDSFRTSTTYDALNRLLSVTMPDGTVYRPAYNEAGLLEAVDVDLAGGATTRFVGNIDYDAKGQRLLLSYGNGAVTSYSYDPSSFRLIGLRTTRPGTADGTASQLFADPAVVQDLAYTYDPVGNITRIGDAAPITVFYGNQQVGPTADYTYDATYRLVAASGREHIGQTTHVPGAGRDRDFAGITAGFGDWQALRTYLETYAYDPAGNPSTVRHVAAGGSWTRTHEYAEPSLLEPAVMSNRLSRTMGGSAVEAYAYGDANGAMTAINDMTMGWDFKDQLSTVDLGGGGTAIYLYDAAGQRVRKVIEDQNGAVRSERIYVGGYELYRSYGAGAVTRSTVHIMDDKQRIALIETETDPVIRYQVGNHLGSAALELDAAGALISFEEYHPYGTTSFQAGPTAAEVSLKRYRYTAKERDEETGLEYHGARYLLPWIGRWASPDPDGIASDSNAFRYCTDNPIRFLDRTGRFEEPVHGALTYRLALAAGFTERDAARLGLATAAVDHNPETAPTGGNTISNARKGITAEYHFPPWDVALDKVNRAVFYGGQSGLNSLGTALHSLEDVGFVDAPGPHLRRSQSSEIYPGFDINVNWGMGVGYSERIVIIPRIESIGSYLLGTENSQHQSVGISHPFYLTEIGELSTPLNHVADQAYQDPKANTKELGKIYEILKHAAKVRYGSASSSDSDAARAIEQITSANTKKKVDAFLNEAPSIGGRTFPSYTTQVSANTSTSVTWSKGEIDSSITDIELNGPYITDKTTGQTFMIPMPAE